MILLATSLNPLAALFFTAAGILFLIGMVFWLVDPNRQR